MNAFQGGPEKRSRVWACAHTLWALVWAGGAFFGALSHPVAPTALLMGLWVLGVVVVWRPTLWLVAVPALLPVADWSPWTGGWLWSEFDLLLCAVLAAGHLRWARDLAAPEHGAAVAAHRQPRLNPHWPPFWRRWTWTAGLALMALWVVGAWRAWVDTGLPTLGFDAGYDQIGNTWRVGKSLLWLCVLMPLLGRAVALEGQQVLRRLVAGTLIGLLWVCLLVLVERFLYAGGLDFTRSYRTSAWFWEMHVGGGAIDAYLAMTAPLAIWAVWAAQTPARWGAAALLLLLTVFALLTTFSRGVYLVGAGTALLLWATVVFLRWDPAPHVVWRRKALRLLWLVVALEAGGVLVWSTFMADRLDDTEEAAYQRLAHWRDGIDLVDTPVQRWLGLGQGRLPAHYSQRVEGGGFPGHVGVLPAPGAGAVLNGPAAGTSVEGYLFGLTQKVDLKPGGRYQARLKVVAVEPVQMMVRLCERHLLYDLRCQWRRWSVPATGEQGLERMLVLRGPAFAPDGTLAGLRSGMLTLSVLDEGSEVLIKSVNLTDPTGVQVLRNTAFEQGSVHWMPSAQGHFLPWHMDNLYLETWVERGWLGGGVLGAGVAWILWGVCRGLKRRQPWALAWWLSMASTLVLGLVISFMEMPRVAFMLLLLFFVAPLTRLAGEKATACNINSISPTNIRAG
ncbi:MAG: hypothetical protein RJA09_1661 [Pseudomonadota bacterium]